MSVGKYSPTVSGWYSRDQNWHDLHSDPGEYCDRDGYDSYGYHHTTGRDRAGYTEWDYLDNGQWIQDQYRYPLYEDIDTEWYSKPFPWKK